MSEYLRKQRGLTQPIYLIETIIDEQDQYEKKIYCYGIFR